MTQFTPYSALAGGALIGAAAALLWWTLGRIAGVSTVLSGALTNGEPWRWAFLLGLLLSGLIAKFAFAGALQFDLRAGYGQLILAGLLVGVGTQMSGGCTSGHGVCGVSRLSPRSIVATLCFMFTGMLTVYWIGAGA